MKIIFAGTPKFAAEALSAINAEHDVQAVLTQPDRPSGRGMRLMPSPVKQVAMQLGLPVLQPASLKSSEIQQVLAGFDAEAMVVAAYGLILPKEVLKIPKYGCLNIHASLLPRWRGAAPIQRAIQAGDSLTGITIMQMDEGLDTGAMLLKEPCPIESNDTSASLYDKLASLGADSIQKVLRRIPNEIVAIKQTNSKATYAAKLLKSEAQIDWKLEALTLERMVRAFNPFPLCQFNYHGMNIKLWQANCVDAQGEAGQVLAINEQGITVACGINALCMEVLQKPGGKAQPSRQFLQAVPFKVGELLDVH